MATTIGWFNEWNGVAHRRPGETELVIHLVNLHSQCIAQFDIFSIIGELAEKDAVRFKAKLGLKVRIAGGIRVEWIRVLNDNEVGIRLD